MPQWNDNTVHNSNLGDREKAIRDELAAVAGAVSDASITVTDVTTNNVNTSKHGFAPKAPNDLTKFLRGDASWAAPAGGSTQGVFNVVTYGAVGDGITDDSAAIQSAINALDPNRGGIVYFPFGKYYVATGLTCRAQGGEFVGQGQPGVSDDLAAGSTQIIVGNGQVGLTVGNTDGTNTTQYRGYRVEDLHFYEKNTGLATGGLRIVNTADGHFERVAAGRFTTGYGIFVDSISGGVPQYNTFIDCAVGRCLTGFHQKSGIGTRWLGGQGDGGQNGVVLPLANSVGFYIESGDTFFAFGTLSAGYETLWKLCYPGFHTLQAIRCEYWSGKAVWVVGGTVPNYTRKVRVQGTGDNSLIHQQSSPTDYGTYIEAQCQDVVDDMLYEHLGSATRQHVDLGSQTRSTVGSSAASGGSTLGNVVGKRAEYDSTGVLIGYSPIYDAISGTSIQLVQEIDFDMTLTNVTSLVLQVPAQVTIGDTILIACSCSYATSAVTFSAADSGGSNTYAVDVYHDGRTQTGTSPHAAIIRCDVTATLAAGATITISVNHTVNYIGAYAYEYRGLVSSPLDKTAGADGHSTAPSSGVVTTTAQAHELAFGAVRYGGASSFAAGTGWTSLRDSSQASTVAMAAESQVLFATGTPAATGTVTSGDWNSVIATYKGS